jgi:hypothetical protein
MRIFVVTFGNHSMLLSVFTDVYKLTTYLKSKKSLTDWQVWKMEANNPEKARVYFPLVVDKNQVWIDNDYVKTDLIGELLT